MTDEEKAEEITKRDFCNKLCGEKECSYTIQACPMAQYIYLGSFLGLAEGRKNIEKENTELKAQIEKMKCCQNCNHHVTGKDCNELCFEKFEKWELYDETN